MNKNLTRGAGKAPFHTLLRRRRKQLSLRQSEVAAALRVSPECVTLWEAGRRRMELSKIPRLAAILELDAKELCAQALAEFHPLFYATLFGPANVAQTNIGQAPA